MRPWDLSFPPSLEESWRDFMKKRVKAVKLEQKCSSPALFLLKAVARTTVPSQPGRGELQAPPHPLATLPTAPSATRTHPLEDSW